MIKSTTSSLRTMHRSAPAALCALALLMLTLMPAFGPVTASAATLLKISSEDRVARLKVTQGRSETYRLQVPFGEIVVGDPETADVNALSDRTLYVLGRKLGTTNVTLFDADKNLLAVIDVEVTHDLSGLREAIQKAVPGANLKVQSVNGRVLLEGEVPSAPAADKVMKIAKDFAGDDVTNSFSISANQQVNLEVRIIEVARSAGKDLGFSWNLTNNGNGYAQGAGVVSNAAGGSGGVSAGRTLGAVAGALSGVLPFGTIVANILEQRHLARSPDQRARGAPPRSPSGGAEPHRPIGPVGQLPRGWPGAGADLPRLPLRPRPAPLITRTSASSLQFTPTVMDDGLINLLINPQVSEIDPSLSFNGNPGFITRSANTSVELRDGQSFAIAGLLQSLNAKDASQVPWIGDVPVVGTLFRSSSFQKKESDLVIIVTPRLVRPVGTEQMLKDPLNDGLVSSNEPEFFLMGKQEVSRKSLDKQYNGVYGHIIDLPQVNYGAPQK